MEVYLKNLHGQEYKMVPIENTDKTILPVEPETPPVTTKVKPAPKDAPEPPELRLD